MWSTVSNCVCCVSSVFQVTEQKKLLRCWRLSTNRRIQMVITHSLFFSSFFSVACLSSSFISLSFSSRLLVFSFFISPFVTCLWSSLSSLHVFLSSFFAVFSFPFCSFTFCFILFFLLFLVFFLTLNSFIFSVSFSTETQNKEGLRFSSCRLTFFMLLEFYLCCIFVNQ